MGEESLLPDRQRASNGRSPAELTLPHYYDSFGVVTMAGSYRHHHHHPHHPVLPAGRPEQHE